MQTTAALVGVIIPGAILFVAGAYVMLLLTLVFFCVYALLRESHIEERILLGQIRNVRRVAKLRRYGILSSRR